MRAMLTIILLGAHLASSAPLSVASGSCNVRDYGAIGDNHTFDTAAVKAAMDDCGSRFPDDATIVFPAPGLYLTAAFNISRSNTRLHIEAGAAIVGSPNKEDYPFVKAIYGDFMYSGLISAYDLDNITITGDNGTIHGNAWKGGWYSDQRHTWKGWQKGPRLLQMIGVQNLEVSNLTLLDGARWHLHTVNCRHVRAFDLRIHAPRTMGGTDGIDPDSCEDVYIHHVHIDVGDDAISVKAGGGGPSKNILIRKAKLIGRNFAIGDHTDGTISDVRLEDSEIGDDHGSSAWGIKFKSSQKGVCENIVLRRLKLGRIVPNYSGGGFALQMTSKTALFKNVTIEDVVATSVRFPGTLGTASMPVEGLTLRNVSLPCEDDSKCVWHCAANGVNGSSTFIDVVPNPGSRCWPSWSSETKALV